MNSNNYYESEIFENLNISAECYEDFEFVDCEFKNCNFIDVKLLRCSFSECKFNSCHISMIEQKHSRLRLAEFDSCFIQGINWAEFSLSPKSALPFSSFGGSKLKYNIFADLRLAGFDFSGCSILESTFSECSLKKANFNGCPLENTEFYRNDMADADFRDASYYKIDIMSNKMKNAKFSFPEAINLLGCLGIKIE